MLETGASKLAPGRGMKRMPPHSTNGMNSNTAINACVIVRSLSRSYTTQKIIVRANEVLGSCTIYINGQIPEAYAYATGGSEAYWPLFT